MAKRMKCPRCSRSFKMKAHLVRHLSATHGQKSARSSARGSARRPVGRPRLAASATSAGSLFGERSDRILGDMRAAHAELMMQRETLDSQIDGIARAMEVMGDSAPAVRAFSPLRSMGVKRAAPAARQGRKRSSGEPRAGSLKDYIVRVLRQHTSPLSPRELGAKIKKSGFKTKSSDLTKAVSNALPQLKTVKKIGFGKYLLSR